MREDLTSEIARKPATKGMNLKFSHVWFGRFWIGPNARGMVGGPIVYFHVDVEESTKVWIKASGKPDQLAVYLRSASEGLFLLLHKNHRPTGRTITLTEAIREFSDKLTVA